MRDLIKYVVALLCLIPMQSIWAQNAQTACRLENGMIIYQINLGWNHKQRTEAIKHYDIDSMVLVRVFEGLTRFTVHDETWTVERVSQQRVELSKNLDSKRVAFVNKNDGILMFDDGADIPGYSGAEFANYGVNRFDPESAFCYKDGVATFYLSNHDGAEKVYLSGSFNNWSTMQTPMHRCDSGWVVKIKLQPGKYRYKYIIDGSWRYDRHNLIRERDGNWGYNSIVYCYNFRFVLKDKRRARKVYVAGSFNGWNVFELQMKKTGEGWELPLFLREGTHAYKFIVDGKWITDPANKVTHSDGNGNTNSFVGVGDEHVFKFKCATLAHKVYLTGNFNAWNKAELEMQRVKNEWQLSYALAAGNYEYKFVLDEGLVLDPQNPYTVGSGAFTNSFLAFKANHIFTLNGYQSANKVIVTGSFNGWNIDSYRMVKKDGKWIFPIYLKPGKYTYKFTVDAKWILDPDNKLWENNEYGTGNSVLWIEP